MAYEIACVKKKREKDDVLAATKTAREHKRLARNLRVAARNMGRSIMVATKAPRGIKTGLSQRAGDSGALGNRVLSPFILHSLWV